jgi:CobQ/CobB/MinD/ParA nucleotide binding domain
MPQKKFLHMPRITAKSDKMSEPARDHGRALGAILVEQGRLKPNDLDEIQRFAGESGLRFGDAAQKLGLLTQRDVDMALAQQFNYPTVPRGGVGGVADDVVAAYLPQSELIEPLRALRSQLNLRWVSEHRLLAITSPERGEGRSWLAANLATVFAQMGKRTLLIDSDMRHPRQHQLFNLNNAVGLSALLTGRDGRLSREFIRSCDCSFFRQEHCLRTRRNCWDGRYSTWYWNSSRISTTSSSWIRLRCPRSRTPRLLLHVPMPPSF